MSHDDKALEIPRFLTNPTAAKYLGCAPRTLQSSRSKGLLLGVKPPRHTKRGVSVFYEICDLDQWLEQFEGVKP